MTPVDQKRAKMFYDDHPAIEPDPSGAEVKRMMKRHPPNVMLGNRGIGKYDDCYTPERVVLGAKVSTVKPGFCIYPLGSDFSDNQMYPNTRALRIVDLWWTL